MSVALCSRSCVCGACIDCRGSKYVEDRFTGARFQPECAGEISPVGEIVKIGADASGLLISPTQVR
jgi:coatomer protein complex subunit alpha (xenin)